MSHVLFLHCRGEENKIEYLLQLRYYINFTLSIHDKSLSAKLHFKSDKDRHVIQRFKWKM